MESLIKSMISLYFKFFESNLKTALNLSILKIIYKMISNHSITSYYSEGNVYESM